MIFRVEVEKRLQITFYVDAESQDQAGEVAEGATESLDDMDWDDWHGWDYDVKEVETRAEVTHGGQPAKFPVWEGRKLVMTPAMLAEEVKDKNVWVGGPGGTWHGDLEWQKPKPPAVDPNQGSLLDIEADSPGREIEDGPDL